MDKLQEYVGKFYPTVDEDIKAIAAQNGMTAYPWPEDIGGYDSTDSIVVFINNDMEMKITGFSYSAE